MRRASFALTTLDVGVAEVPETGAEERIPPWPESECIEKQPVIRLFGVTLQGASVCAHVHGFRPAFYAELTETVADSLVTSPEEGSHLARPGDLAKSIEAAAAQAGMRTVRVADLRLERGRSIYGCHLESSPFLKVELADARHIDGVAGLLQDGRVAALGCPQAHEAHLPYLLQFLAQHHVSGAGCIRVVGTPRSDEALSGKSGLPKQTCCSLELDVTAPDGILNYGDYMDVLRRAGQCPEARAQAALNARLSAVAKDTGGGNPGTMVDNESARPTPGARTTPLVTRQRIQRWLRGDASEVAASSAMDGYVHRRGAAAADIEDLVCAHGSSSSSSSAASQPRESSPARYSDRADDPRWQNKNGSDLSREKVTATDPAGRTSHDTTVSTCTKSGSDAVLVSGIGAQIALQKQSSRQDIGTHDTSRSVADDMAWEDICAILSVEVILTSDGRHAQHSSGNTVGDPATSKIAAVAYALRPHSCQLGGQCFRRQDRQAAIIVGTAQQNFGLCELSGDLCFVASEMELLDQFAAFVREVDADVCLGWEIRNHSWGFLCARARLLGRAEFCRALSRAPKVCSSMPFSFFRDDPPDSSADKQSSASAWRPRGGRESSDPRTYDSEMLAPSSLQFPGRLVLNVWRVLTNLTFGAKMRSDAPQEAARELLGRSLPYVDAREMERLWLAGGVDGRLAALRHAQALAKLSLEVFDILEVLPRAGELSRLFGMDVLSTFTRGTQLRVESVLMRVARAAGFFLLSASQASVRAQPALECLPLVMEPFSGFYWDPVLVLDFKGMYPSLIVAHNISYDTCLGQARRIGHSDKLPTCQLGVRSEPWRLGSEADVAELAEAFDGDPVTAMSADSPVRKAPCGVLFVAQTVRRGILPTMLDWALKLRADAKKAMKLAPPKLASRLNQRQFALKYFANVTYGYAGASFSGRMPSAEIADSIVSSGRRALEEAANLIESSVPGAKVIYGDTDSVFVQLKGASLEEAFTVGRRLVKDISKLHPSPVELEFEKVYYPCLCLTKKRYGGLAYSKAPSEGGEPQFEAKGLEAVRRDQCRLTSNFQRELLGELFRTKDLSHVKKVFIQRVSDLLRGGVSGPPLPDLVFHREARLGTYRAEDEDGGSATLPPQATVARNTMAAEGEAAGPEFGERVSYVVVCGATGARLIDRCVPPTEVAEGGCKNPVARPIDRWWYAEKAVLPSISRMLHSELYGLDPVDVGSWLRCVPRPGHLGNSRPLGYGSRSSVGTLDGLFRPMCTACKIREAVHRGSVCRSCASPVLLREAKLAMQQFQTEAESIRAACVNCAGDPLWRSCKSAAFCPTFSKRMLAEEAAAQSHDHAVRLGAVPAYEDELVVLSDSDSEQRITVGEANRSQRDVSSTTNVKREASDISERHLGHIEVDGVTPVGASATGSWTEWPNCSLHGEVCKTLVVQMAGPNFGRRFFACARPPPEQCDFLMWVDSRAAGSSPTSSGYSTSVGLPAVQTDPPNSPKPLQDASRHSDEDCVLIEPTTAPREHRESMPATVKSEKTAGGSEQKAGQALGAAGVEDPGVQNTSSDVAAIAQPVSVLDPVATSLERSGADLVDVASDMARTSAVVADGAERVDVVEGDVASSAATDFFRVQHPMPAPRKLPSCVKHGEPCKELEVKKQGPNLGRRFFACARPREEQCNFFLWADASEAMSASRRSLQRDDNVDIGSSSAILSPPMVVGDGVVALSNASAVLVAQGAAATAPISAVTIAQNPAASRTPPNCKVHGEPCKEVEVKKQGPNLGRQFFACARPREEQCNFFMWADVPAAVLADSKRALQKQDSAESSGARKRATTPRRSRPKKDDQPAGKTPRKRARPSSQGGRLERYVPAPSRQVAERIERALEHRLKLIKAELGDQGAVMATVLGHSGNVYDVSLGSRVECSCPDFVKTRRSCKHIVFVYVAVLEVPKDDVRIWQRALIPQEVRDLQTRLHSHLASPRRAEFQAGDAVVSAHEAAGRRAERKQLGDRCRVCLDIVYALVGCLCCAHCGENFHQECINQLHSAGAEAAPACPSCRSKWDQDEVAAASRTKPGRPLPRHMNLAAYSELHAAPMSLEESYPATHQWIAQRDASANARKEQGRAPS